MYFEGCIYAVNQKAFSFRGLQSLEEIPDLSLVNIKNFHS